MGFMNSVLSLTILMKIPNKKIQKALTDAIHVGARPLTVTEWRTLLEAEGFIVHTQATTPMHLLEPKRLIQDEGIWGALRFVGNVLTGQRSPSTE